MLQAIRNVHMVCHARSRRLCAMIDMTIQYIAKNYLEEYNRRAICEMTRLGDAYDPAGIA
jgi:hypothetical protein